MSKNIFVAINGDDCGSRIGEAIANDDHKALQHASASIQSAHDEVDQWIESIGGKKITGSGDEAIYMIPQDSLSDIDSIREHYQQKSGHGLTVGTGASMSQASKALIYGKLNGKNQVVHYEPMIEDYLSDNGEEDQDQDSAAPEVPEQDDLQDQADDGLEADQGMGDLEEDPSEESEEGQEEMDADPSMDEQSSQDNQTEVPNAPEQESQLDSEPEAGNEDDMSNDDQKTSEAPGEPVSNKTAGQKQPKKLPGEPEQAGYKGAIDGVSDEDLGTGEQNINEDPNQVPDEDQDQGMEMEAEQVDPETADSEDGEDVSDADIAQDPSNVNGDQFENSDEDMQDQGSTPELSDEDVEAPQEDEQAPQEDDQEDPLASMIHGDMQADDEEQDPSQEDQDSSLDDELKQDIASALMAFKENKEMLEQAREQNPKLYDATLTMLRSMISMAKKLGFAPEQDMQDAENNQQLQENFPEAEQSEQDDSEQMPGDMQSEDQEEQDEDPAASTLPPAKGAAPTKK